MQQENHQGEHGALQQPQHTPKKQSEGVRSHFQNPEQPSERAESHFQNPKQQLENAVNSSQDMKQHPQALEQTLQGKKWLLLVGFGVVFALGVGVALLASGGFNGSDHAEEVLEVTEVVEVEPVTEEEPVVEVEDEAEPEPEDEVSDEPENLTGNIGMAENDIFVMVNSDGYYGM